MSFNWGNNNNNNNSNGFGSFGNSNNNSIWGNGNNSSNNSNSNSWNNNSSSTVNPNNDVMLENPPNDCISCLRFNPSFDLFAVSSWNNTIYAYQYEQSSTNEIKTRCIGQQSMDRGVLCCCWDQSGSRIFCGGCDGTVRIWNVQNGNNSFVNLGTHSSGIKCIEYAADFNMLISGSWDRTLNLYDIRSGQRISVINVNGKVFCSAQRGKVLVVGLSNKYVQVIDLRKYQQYVSLEKTALKHQLRAMDIFPDQRGYACSSIEGRTAIKYFDSFDSKKDFSFKCHRHQRGNDKHAQDVFGVNCLRFNLQFGTFATGGDDGQINIWDKENRSRLKHFEQIKINEGSDNNNNHNENMWSSLGTSKVNNTFMPITTLDFSKNGRILGYATSYNWNKGISYFNEQQHRPQIYLHNVTQKEVDANWSG